MSFFGKVYTQYKQENFDAFLKAAGLSDEKVQAYLTVPATIKVALSGDTYTISQTGPDGNKDTTFKSGVEFNYSIGGNDSSTTFTVDGNTITQELKTDRGNAIFKREFNGDELLVTITSDSFDGVARRYYKA